MELEKSMGLTAEDKKTEARRHLLFGVNYPFSVFFFFLPPIICLCVIFCLSFKVVSLSLWQNMGPSRDPLDYVAVCFRMRV